MWLARALPADGRVVTIEAEPANAGVARANIDRAGVGPLGSCGSCDMAPA
ncbi:MAG: hypothetical protein AAGC63_09670 [Propionicimonas sp.]